jgi:hypothetical protein
LITIGNVHFGRSDTLRDELLLFLVFGLLDLAASEALIEDIECGASNAALAVGSGLGGRVLLSAVRPAASARVTLSPI